MVTYCSLSTCLYRLCVFDDLYVKYVILTYDPLSWKWTWWCLHLLTDETVLSAFWRTFQFIILRLAQIKSSVLDWQLFHFSSTGLYMQYCHFQEGSIYIPSRGLFVYLEVTSDSLQILCSLMDFCLFHWGWHSIVLISGIYQSDSVIYLYIYMYTHIWKYVCFHNLHYFPL